MSTSSRNVAGTLRVPPARPVYVCRPSRCAVTAHGVCLLRGFTLVELLVVITIIGMLVALLLPAVQAVRRNAQQTECTNNIRQIATAMISYETSKGNLPGYAQYVRRSNPTGAPANSQTWVGAALTGTKVVVRNATDSSPPLRPEEAGAWEISWAAMLLSRMDRQDYWDQLVDGNLTPEILLLEFYICPSDNDIKSRPDLAALSYSANTGAWDRNASGVFLIGPNQGDKVDNGALFNLAQGGPRSRIGGMKDPSNMTILLSENAHKNYDDPNVPFTWLAGTEQQLGIVWVVPGDGNTTPTSGTGINQQEPINVVPDSVVIPTDFAPGIPRFARPSSNHGEGAVVAFCDGHVTFLREDIDYTVYQRLLTTNGRKCVDPTDHTQTAPSTSIGKFRVLPPLSESDYQ